MQVAKWLDRADIKWLYMKYQMLITESNRTFTTLQFWPVQLLTKRLVSSCSSSAKTFKKPELLRWHDKHEKLTWPTNKQINFQARGACNAVMLAKSKMKSHHRDFHGIVTHSSGNHGQAVAYACSKVLLLIFQRTRFARKKAPAVYCLIALFFFVFRVLRLRRNTHW